MSKKYISFFFIIITLFLFPNCVEAVDHVGLTLVQPFRVYSMYDLVNLNSDVKAFYEKYKIKMNEQCSTLYGEDYTYFNYFYTPNPDALKDTFRKHEKRIIFNGRCFSDKRTKNSGIVNFSKFYSSISGSFYFETSGSYLSYYGYSMGSDSLYTEKMNYGYFREQITLFSATDNEFNYFIDSNHVDYRITSVPELWHSSDPKNHHYFDSFNINGVNYVPNDYIIRNLVNTVPVVVPKLVINEVEHELNDDETYKSKTLEFSFDVFDNTKYSYKYSANKEEWHEFEAADLCVQFTTNSIIYFMVYDSNGNELKSYSYEINDINERKFGDPSLDISDSENPNFSDVNVNETLGDDSSLGSLFQWFYNNITNKFRIIIQAKEIYDSWTSYDPRYDNKCNTLGGRNEYGVIVWSQDWCAPDLKFDLRLPGFETQSIPILDFSIVGRIRYILWDYIRLVLYIYTFFKCVKIISETFGGSGDS